MDTSSRSHTPSPQLSFALDICQKAGSVAMKYFQTGIEFATKYDGSPVTIADRQCEQLIRESLSKEFPQDIIWGEEDGETRSETSHNQRKWIIDPIDGTYNFVRGISIFSTLLALEENGEIVLGIIHAPAMGETYWAEKGAGAYKNGMKIRVSDCQDLRKSQFNFGGPGRILELGYWAGLKEVVTKTGWQRCYGDYKNFSLVFEGKSEASFEVGLHPWDLAPMKIIVEESGGRFSDLERGSSIYQGSCLISNGWLHEEILDMLLLH